MRRSTMRSILRSGIDLELGGPDPFHRKRVDHALVRQFGEQRPLRGQAAAQAIAPCWRDHFRLRHGNPHRLELPLALIWTKLSLPIAKGASVIGGCSKDKEWTLDHLLPSTSRYG